MVSFVGFLLIKLNVNPSGSLIFMYERYMMSGIKCGKRFTSKNRTAFFNEVPTGFIDTITLHCTSAVFIKNMKKFIVVEFSDQESISTCSSNCLNFYFRSILLNKNPLKCYTHAHSPNKH